MSLALNKYLISVYFVLGTDDSAQQMMTTKNKALPLLEFESCFGSRRRQHRRQTNKEWTIKYAWQGYKENKTSGYNKVFLGAWRGYVDRFTAPFYRCNWQTRYLLSYEYNLDYFPQTHAVYHNNSHSFMPIHF